MDKCIRLPFIIISKPFYNQAFNLPSNLIFSIKLVFNENNLVVAN